ncbi:MAG TPA: type IX secretion system membrane protein PorP/SprF [Bacteroidia bacterium]|nr:type IX secretion system membrane protein PorP/SprF [Bacteroidia bacterium]
MRKAGIVILLVFSGMFARAQQHPLFSHYMFNGLYINPAYAGSKEFVSTTLIARKQWAGFQGAPTTQIASLHAPLSNKKVGLGFSISNDRIGITNEMDVFGSYAYHIETNNGILSLGLSGGFSYFKSQLSDLNYWDQNDPVYEVNSLSNILPNFGAGIYYYTNKFYAGLSVPQILSYDPDASVSINVDRAHKVTRHYFLTSGMIISTRGELKFRPSFLVKYTDNAPVEFDLNMNMLISEIIWIGVSYRSEDAIVALLEYQVNKKLRVGYSYDYTLSEIRNYSSGSHELILGYDFGFNVKKMKTPRYF